MFDCAVVGGGPAGSVLAGTLARDGLSVLLADDGRARHVMPVETLLPASVQALQRSGIGEVVAAAAAVDVARHGAYWGSSELVLQQEGDRGFAVRRGPFDAALRAWAGAGGAVLREGCAARAVATDGSTVTLVDANGGSETVRANVIAVAAGRRVAAALVPLQVAERGAPLAAVCLTGVQTGADGADLAVVEAVPTGWLWSMPLGGDGVALGVFLDGDEVEARGLHATVDAAIAAAHGPARELAAARLHAAVRATPRFCVTACPVLLLGDAAATIDPLASQGVAKAIAAADAAAAAVRTILRHPGRRALALAHHARWERGLFRAHLATARAFYAQETRFPDAPFWRARAAGSANAARAPQAPPTTMPSLLQRAADVEEQPGLRRAGPVFEPATAFAKARDDEPLTHIGFVPVAPLLSAFATARSLSDGIALAGQDPRVFALPPAAVRDAVLELLARGFLMTPAAAAGVR